MMEKVKQCVLCGTKNSCGLLVMGQYICLDCQPLLDDPKRRVFGCNLNRHFAKSRARENLELIKTKN